MKLNDDLDTVIDELQQCASLCGRPIDRDQAARLQQRLERLHGGRSVADIPLRSFMEGLLVVRGNHDELPTEENQND